ncbi:MAG: HNH endonuclease signature motif containing protein [Ornithinibacter sp.]
MACDAALVPHVLGSAGEDLDLGRVVRLFTRAQRRRLWRRDRCCTFPGCAAPGSWTRAHHVLHWADGGLSDVDNAALLCQRHHTVVHTRRLWASVRARPDELGRYVVWDLSVGSYDRKLDQLRRDRAGQDPPPLTRQRLLDLVASVTSDAEADRRLAQHDLDQLSDAWQQWQHQLDTAVGDDDPAYRAWHESYLASVASTIPAAA